jgi:hypothetical protein
MANKKFSEFTVKTDPANVDFVVGYDGTDNVRIDPANLVPAAPVDSVNTQTGVVSLGLTDLDDVGADGTSGQVLTTDGSGSFTFADAGGGGGAGLVSGTGSDSMASDGSLNPTGNAAIASGTRSIALGVDSPFAGTNPQCEANGADGVAIGSSAFADGTNAISIGNVAKSKSSDISIGNNSGRYASSGGNNVRIGNSASNFSASFSVYVGSNSGRNANNGNFNAAVGADSLKQTTGNNNTSIGYQAGENLSSGTNNTLIGSNSAPSVNTISNEITLGDSSVSTLRCAVTTITSLSDERDKSDIKDLEYGLDFIDSLQPREFVWDNRAETRKQPVFNENGEISLDEDGEVVTEDVEFYSSNKGKKDFGFIAQEVKELDNDTLRLVYSENEDKLEMSYGKLVPILVKAIQELKAEVDSLK